MNKGGGVRRYAALIAAVLVLGVAGWWLRDGLPFARRGTPEATEISPEAAASAETKLRALRERGETVRLSEVEVASLLRYRAPVWAAGVVNQPTIEMSEDTVRLSGLVPTDRLPAHPQLDQVRAFLPESSRVEVAGVVRPLAPGRIAVAVAEISFAGIPIPARYYGEMLVRMGRRDEPGLPANAFAVPLPVGVSEVRVQDGSLVLSP